eukprot:SAG22_NODE_446_length_10427_cov_14.973373_1_plen_35_part_00
MVPPWFCQFPMAKARLRGGQGTPDMILLFVWSKL